MSVTLVETELESKQIALVTISTDTIPKRDTAMALLVTTGIREVESFQEMQLPALLLPGMFRRMDCWIGCFAAGLSPRRRDEPNSILPLQSQSVDLPPFACECPPNTITKTTIGDFKMDSVVTVRVLRVTVDGRIKRVFGPRSHQRLTICTPVHETVERTTT